MTVCSWLSLFDGPISVSGRRPSPTTSDRVARHELIDERAIDLLVHHDTACRGAALSGRPEPAPETAVDGELEVGVIHDHDDVLAAHLEMDLLEAGSRRLIHDPADMRRPRERHDAHSWIGRERRADFVAVAGDHVDDTAGMPASSRTFTKFTADSGVCDAGLKTTVLPQTSAGMIFHDGIAIGKFHGVMTETRRAAAAPTSRTCCAVPTAPSARTCGVLHPPCRRSCRWPPARRRGVSLRTLPISRVISRAKSSLRSTISWATRKRTSARFGAGTRRHRS